MAFFIKTIYDIENKSWSIDTSAVGFEANEVQIVFHSTDDTERDISNLEFGFYLRKNEEEIAASHHPIPPIKYEKSKTAIMFAVMTELIPNETYSIEAYARDLVTKENIDTKQCTFKTTLRPKKFESWTWNDDIKDWEPPTPNPDPSAGVDDPIPHKLYQWSERRQQWVEGLPEEVQD